MVTPSTGELDVVALISNAVKSSSTDAGSSSYAALNFASSKSSLPSFPNRMPTCES